MRKFLVQIIMHENYPGERIPSTEHDLLHEFMEGDGAVRTIEGHRGCYHLLDGNYLYHTDDTWTAIVVREDVARILRSIERRKSIFVIQYSSAAWSGITPMPPTLTDEDVEAG